MKLYIIQTKEVEINEFDPDVIISKNLDELKLNFDKCIKDLHSNESIEKTRKFEDLIIDKNNDLFSGGEFEFEDKYGFLIIGHVYLIEI